MLPREVRLTRERDFRAAYRRGRSCVLPQLVLYVRPAEHDGIRVGFSVGRKVGNAVVRNRVKRLLREACRQCMNQWRPGYDAVFVARAPVRALAFTEVVAAVRDLASRAKIADVTAPEIPACADAASA